MIYFVLEFIFYDGFIPKLTHSKIFVKPSRMKVRRGDNFVCYFSIWNHSIINLLFYYFLIWQFYDERSCKKYNLSQFSIKIALITKYNIIIKKKYILHLNKKVHVYFFRGTGGFVKSKTRMRRRSVFLRFLDHWIWIWASISRKVVRTKVCNNCLNRCNWETINFSEAILPFLWSVARESWSILSLFGMFFVKYFKTCF